MWLVLMALRRPVSILVAVLTVVLASILAVRQMKVDIFPKLGAPAIYVAQPYGGMDPSQMEGYLTYYYEYHFLYITGIEHVESKNIQGVSLMKLVFHPDTDMSQAMAEVVGYVNRSRAFMPPGAVPPFIMRYDAGSVPVAQLVLSSANRSPGEMQDIALNRVRPIFATLPGVSAPPPFGGNQRSIVVRVEPEKMRAYRLSPEEVVSAVNRASVVLPSGNLRTGNLVRFASTNAALGGNIQELLDAPARLGSGPTVYLRDIGTIEDSTDVVVGYAHVNGRRTVYIPVTKRADASTLDVVGSVRAALPRMRSAAPEDVRIDLVFDQSGYVVNALRSLVSEGALGACLTGLMVLLFLRDLRSALVVVATIPFALLSAVVCLGVSGQTINIMTLGGLALAVGVLVDEATVAIESIHTHLASGLGRARAVLEASRKTAAPRLLAMLCVLSVFMPSFFMTGPARQLFVPLSLAVGFAMLSSYVLSSTLVPVLSTWLIRRHGQERAGLFEKIRSWYGSYVRAVLRFRWPVLAGYVIAAGALIYILFRLAGMEIFPTVESRHLQVRVRAPAGTRVERTEAIALKAMDIIRQRVGPESIDITTGFIGVQPPSYPINTIYLFTSGQHESLLGVALKPAAPPVTEDLKEDLRRILKEALPDVTFSFEPGDIISQVMSFGSPTPIEVAVQGPALAANREFAEKLRIEMEKVPSLRDLHYAQPLDYPAVQVSIDRERAGQFGITTADVARSLVAATSSSRFTDPNFWRDPRSGNAFQIQVEIPQYKMASLDDVRAARALARAYEGSLNASRASVQALKELEGYLTITAPFDGVITERNVHPGYLVGPGAGSTTPMLRLEQSSRLRLVVAVPEAQAGGIPSGAHVSFTVLAYPGEVFHGKVSRVAHSVDARTRTMAVELDVGNRGLRLAPGMYPEVLWPVRPSRPSLLVPAASIVTTTERTFVIRVKDGVTEWVSVTRGAVVGNEVEVYGLLKPGDLVIRRGSDELREGTRVKAQTLAN